MKYTKPVSIAALLLLLGVTATTSSSFSSVQNMAAAITNQDQNIFVQCIASFSDKDVREFETTFVRLNADKIDDGIIRYTSGEHCGSVGCVYEICLSEGKGKYRHVAFGFAAETLTVEETITNGLNDLTLNNDASLKMSFNGTAYTPSNQ